MAYIDGFVVPVPQSKRDAYEALARKASALFIEYGALQVVEAWGDDVPRGKVTDFYGAVQCADDEVLVFSWIVWPSKAVRDAGQKKTMEDPRMQPDGELPFSGQRMIYGGFAPMLMVDSKR